MKRILFGALLVSTTLGSSQLMASAMSDGHNAKVATAPLFNPKVYVELNKELQVYIQSNPAEIAAAGGPNKWAIKHYLKYGRHQGRQFQNVAPPAPAVQPITYSYGVRGNGVAQLDENWNGRKFGFPMFKYDKKVQAATVMVPKPAFEGYVQVTLKGVYLGADDQAVQKLYWLVNGQPFPVYNVEGEYQESMKYKPVADLQVDKSEKKYELIIPGKFADEKPFLELGFKFETPSGYEYGLHTETPLDEGFLLQSITVEPYIDFYNKAFLEQLIKNDFPEGDPQAGIWVAIRDSPPDEESKAKIAKLEDEAAIEYKQYLLLDKKGEARKWEERYQADKALESIHKKIRNAIEMGERRLYLKIIRNIPAIMDNLEFRAADFWADHKAEFEDKVSYWRKELASDNLTPADQSHYKKFLAGFEADLRKNAQIRLQRAARMTDGVVDKTLYKTDENWKNSISLKWAGFLVPNKAPFSDIYKTGSFVTFTNDETRQITSIDINGSYIHVHVDGAILDSREVGFPVNFTVRDAETKRLEEEEVARRDAEIQRLEAEARLDAEIQRLDAEAAARLGEAPREDERKAGEAAA